jgi:hypothetical protein
MCSCSFVYGIGNVGFSYRGLVSLTRGKTFENEHAKQSVVESARVKSYRISGAAFSPPLYSLRRMYGMI